MDSGLLSDLDYMPPSVMLHEIQSLRAQLAAEQAAREKAEAECIEYRQDLDAIQGKLAGLAVRAENAETDLAVCQGGEGVCPNSRCWVQEARDKVTGQLEAAKAEQRRDALDGQATMEEAYNGILALEAELARVQAQNKAFIAWSGRG